MHRPGRVDQQFIPLRRGIGRTPQHHEGPVRLYERHQDIRLVAAGEKLLERAHRCHDRIRARWRVM